MRILFSLGSADKEFSSSVFLLSSSLFFQMITREQLYLLLKENGCIVDEDFFISKLKEDKEVKEVHQIKNSFKKEIDGSSSKFSNIDFDLKVNLVQGLQKIRETQNVYLVDFFNNHNADILPEEKFVFLMNKYKEFLEKKVKK